MASNDRLNEKQRRYAENLASGMASIPAAKAAGYSDSYAKVATFRLRSKSAVAKAVESVRMEARKMAVYDLAKAMAESEQVIEFAKTHKNPMAYFKAVEHRAKLSGLLIDRLFVETVDVLGALNEARSRVPRVVNLPPLPLSEHGDSGQAFPATLLCSPGWDPFAN